jgi:hypothetical protein
VWPRQTPSNWLDCELIREDACAASYFFVHEPFMAIESAICSSPTRFRDEMTAPKEVTCHDPAAQ